MPCVKDGWIDGIFEDEISGHSHLIKVENHENLIENIEMR